MGHLRQLFGVVFRRFKAVPRLWCVWLAGVTLGCLFCLSPIEAQVVPGVTGHAAVAQPLMSGRLGVTRVLGIAHILWLPMFVRMAFRLDARAAEPALSHWLAVLLVTNALSPIIDGTDVLRYLNGERAPHCAWHPARSEGV